MRIISPQPNGLVYGDRLIVEVQGFLPDRIDVTLDDEPVDVSWVYLPYWRRMATAIPLGPPDDSRMQSISIAYGRIARNRWFYREFNDVLAPAERVATGFMEAHAAADLKWNASSGLLMYGLSRILASTGRYEESILSYLKSFYATHSKGGQPEINGPADVMPVLALIEAGHAFDISGLEELAGSVSFYLKNAKRLEINALNHLDRSTLVGRLYPRSIWVESLMSYALPAVRLGLMLEDEELVNFGLDQPVLFAELLQSPKNGLFKHAFNVTTRSQIPYLGAYWLRGNAMAAAAIVDMLSVLPAEFGWTSEKLRLILFRLLTNAYRYQMQNGLWDAVMNDPGYAFADSAGSALLAYATIKAIRLEFIDRELYPFARRTFECITTRLKQEDDAYIVTGAARPAPPLSAMFYKGALPEDNQPDAVGAYLLLANEVFFGEDAAGYVDPYSDESSDIPVELTSTPR